MKWYLAIILFLMQFVIVVIAGVIIHFLEFDDEQERSSASIRKFNAFIDEKKCLSNSDLKILYDSIIGLESSGLTFQKEDFGTSWDFQSSFYASMQIISGAGFGASSPKTAGGKVFLVFYSSFGVALFLVISFGLGEQMLKVSDLLRRKIWSTATLEDSWKVFLFRSVLLLVAGFIIFSIIFGGIFCAIDPNLNYGEVLSIISIISVGPGDFIPGGRNSTFFKSWYRLLVGFWTIASIIWFSGIFSTIRRSILQYYDNLEPPAALDHQRIPNFPLSTVVNVTSNMGSDKATILRTDDEFKFNVSSGHVNTIIVG